MNQPLPIVCKTKPATDWRQAIPLPLLEAALILTWSSGFVGARFSIDYAPALLVVFWRCVVVTLILLPFVARQLRRTSPVTLLKNAGIGLLAMSGYLFGVIQGIALGVPAGLAALFADLLPMGMALLAALVLRQRLVWQVWAGLFVGLLGVVLVTHGALAWGEAPLWAYGLPLLGMLSLAVATLWQKHLPAAESMGLLPNLWLQCCVSSVAFGVIEG
ncbi:EamA family transporter, partial [Pseudomonas prosekii]